MNECKYIIKYPEDMPHADTCGYYYEVKRKDGLKWCHFPICSDSNCPIKNPSLLNGEQPL